MARVTVPPLLQETQEHTRQGAVLKVWFVEGARHETTTTCDGNVFLVSIHYWVLALGDGSKGSDPPSLQVAGGSPESTLKDPPSALPVDFAARGRRMQVEATRGWV